MFHFVCGPLVYIRVGVSCHCIIQAVDLACSPSSKKECWRFVTSLFAITKTDSVVQGSHLRVRLELISSISVSDLGSVPFVTATQHGAGLRTKRACCVCVSECLWEGVKQEKKQTKQNILVKIKSLLPF